MTLAVIHGLVTVCTPGLVRNSYSVRLLGQNVCVFITAVPITKLFARGGGGMEDMCYERLRAKAGVN